MSSKTIRTVSVFFLLIFWISSFTACRALRFFNKKSADEKKVESPLPPPAPANAVLPPGMAPSPESFPAPFQNPQNPQAPESYPDSAPFEPLDPAAQNLPQNPGQPVPQETGNITVFAGSEKKVAEGSYFFMEDAQAASSTAAALTYQWSLVQGPADQFQIVQEGTLQGAFKVLNILEPTPFVLRLTVSAGAAQNNSQVLVTAYPVRLELKKHLGGITRQVTRIEDFTYVSRGRTLEIYDAQWLLLSKVDLDKPILEMKGFVHQQKKYLYVLTDEGGWLLVDVSDPKMTNKFWVQQSGANFRDLKITTLAQEVWATAIDQDTGFLWSLQDPKTPQLKLQLKGAYKNLRHLLLWGNALYLVDQDSISILDASTGILKASLPAGGVVTDIKGIEFNRQSYWVASLGEGAGALRVFKMGGGGKLTHEKVFHLKGNPSLELFQNIPSTPLLLLGVKEKGLLSLRLFDLVKEKEIPLDFPKDFSLVALLDMAAGLIGQTPLAVLADASALKIIQLKALGSPVARYKAENVKTTYSTLVAGAVKVSPANGSVFLLDFGSVINPLAPALLEMNPVDLATKNTLVLGDSTYLSDIALTPFSKLNFATTFEDPSVPVSSAGHGKKEGTLRIFSTDTSPLRTLTSSTALFGGKKDGNESRALGLDTQAEPGAVTLAVAVGKTMGAGFRSGLALLKFTLQDNLITLLKGDLTSKVVLTPLADARDVKLSNDGKWALVAAGLEGLVLVDLQKNQGVLKINPEPGTLADRVLISQDQSKVFVSFFNPANASSSIKIFYFNEGKLGLWGNIEGLSSIPMPYGTRTGAMALSEDSLYLFVANGREGLWVYNASDPTAPILVSQLQTHGVAVGVAVGQKYKNIYIADLVNGLEMAEFGF